ncbi:uncharacterized protein LOC143883098 [Tasmannia lanceolata]|uniref:uncharacterized protein LOC143883098 n=1 Tax=Tasmannia lanceolata TaxID=3420 RepID=UPI0040631A83
MYKDLKGNFWWNNLKREIAQYVSQCLTCQVIKAEHQRPPGTLQPLSIPEWKWEEITMDFVSALPGTPLGNDSTWVIVGRLTKTAHFIPIRTGLTPEKLARFYQASIKMAPFKALYGRRCRSSICWDDVGERRLLGQDFVQQAVDKIHLIREHLRTAQSWQKSYADVKRRELEFQIENKYIPDLNHVIELEPLNLREDLSFKEQPVRIVDRKDQVLRRRTIPYVKVQWRNHLERKATWELEEK